MNDVSVSRNATNSLRTADRWSKPMLAEAPHGSTTMIDHIGQPDRTRDLGGLVPL
jgi:hypothetical protein